MKFKFLIMLLVALNCEISFSAENITIETKSGNFFENLVSDTLLLLDPDLKKIIASDFDHVVNNSKFELAVNSWKPRQNPRIRLTNIYNDINNNNIKESFASLVQPVVEIACSPQKFDPLNEVSSKCIKEMLTYPIIQPIVITYTYQPGKANEQLIADLSGLSNSNRYQQMVRTIADIMNSAFEKTWQKNIVVSKNVTKYPIKIVEVDYKLLKQSKKDCSGIPGECGEGRSCIFGIAMGRRFGFCENDATAQTTYKQLDKQFDRMNQEQDRAFDRMQSDRKQRQIEDKLDRIDNKLRYGF